MTSSSYDLFVCAAGLDQSAQPPDADDPARGVRRTLVLLLALAIAAAGGAFALSQRGGGSTEPTPLPLFPERFSQAGFLTGVATKAASYDETATARRTTGKVTVRGTVYVVARCDSGAVHVVLGGLTSSQQCTGSAVGVIAFNLLKPEQLTATVTAAQHGRWGVALYR